MGDTFVKRMGGTAPQTSQIEALGQWLDTIPAPKVSRQLDDAQLKAGVGAFQKAGCEGCHLAKGVTEGPASDFAVVSTGSAQKARKSTVIYFAPAYKQTAEKLAKALEGATIEPLTWKPNEHLVVAVGE